jgi:hypothetical protein
MTKQLTAEAIEAAFAAEGLARSNRRCRVGNIIAEHPVLEPKIMDVEHYSSLQVARVLKALGLGPVSDHVIGKHRRGICICPAPEKEPQA